MQWRVRTRRPGGAEETFTADARLSAGGQLKPPSVPDIPGRET
jgi:hypothetical protein